MTHASIPMISANNHTPSSAANLYPLMRPLLLCGVISGIFVTLVSSSLLAGGSVVVAFACAGLLWLRTEIPIFVFCVFYQWLFIVTGYFYLQASGDYPGMRILGDLNTAIWYSLFGLLALTTGLRMALSGYNSEATSVSHQYDIGKLFWLVILLFSINWFSELSSVQLRLAAFNVAQILHHFLIFRYLFLYLLILAVVQQGTQYTLGFVAFSYVLLPELASSMTKFKELFFLFAIVLLSQWRPFSTVTSERRRNNVILGIVCTLGIFLLIVGIVWSGGLKHSWRTALLTGEVSGTPIEKIQAYRQHAVDSIEHFEPGKGAETLASRMSSGVAYFSHVLRVVPAVTPHENGWLTWRAIRHILMPRFLFPEKPDLGGDSWLVRKYARLNVSGDESGTSIGLGYMAGFYIDFGFPWMLVPLLLYGMLLGLLYRALGRMAPSRELLAAVAAGLFLQHFLSYEGNFTKLLGGILQNFLTLAVVLYIFGNQLNQMLRIDGRADQRRKTHTKRSGRREARRFGYDT